MHTAVQLTPPDHADATDPSRWASAPIGAAVLAFVAVSRMLIP